MKKKPKPEPKPKQKQKPKAKPAPATRAKSPQLTLRQEKYAQLVAGGMLVKEAVRQAGYAPSSLRGMQRNLAVREKIAALRGKVEARGDELALLTIERKRRFLAELVLTPLGGAVKVADQLRAIELDSKLANHFSTEQPPDPDAAARDAAENIRSISERVRQILPVISGGGLRVGG